MHSRGLPHPAMLTPGPGVTKHFAGMLMGAGCDGNANSHGFGTIKQSLVRSPLGTQLKTVTSTLQNLFSRQFSVRERWHPMIPSSFRADWRQASHRQLLPSSRQQLLHHAQMQDRLLRYRLTSVIKSDMKYDISNTFLKAQIQEMS